jgi:hypothetical protein
MSSSSESANVIPPEQPREDTREVIYLVKRPSYTLAIAAPRLSSTHLSWEQAVFQAQFKRQGQLWSCVLNSPELEALYKDLQGLVKYLWILHECPKVSVRIAIPMDDEAN